MRCTTNESGRVGVALGESFDPFHQVRATRLTYLSTRFRLCRPRRSASWSHSLKGPDDPDQQIGLLVQQSRSAAQRPWPRRRRFDARFHWLSRRAMSAPGSSALTRLRMRCG